MSFIQIVNEDGAADTVKDDYAFISSSYSQMAGIEVPTPQVYRSSSLIPAYFRFGAVQNRALTNDGAHDRPVGSLAGILINFSVSQHSSCYY
jgi:hypothetical protein